MRIVAIVGSERRVAIVGPEQPRVRVGRHPEFNDLGLETHLVHARGHVTFVWEGAQVVAIDGSTHRDVTLNGQRIPGRAVVRPGDRVRLGEGPELILEED